MAGFQTVVRQNLAYGVAGEFFTTGPWTTVEAGAGELVAGPLGVQIAQFAFATVAGVVTNAKSEPGIQRFGFVGRAGQRALITGFMEEAGMTINPGFEVTLYKTGSFQLVAPVGGAVIGQKVFAPYAGGAVTLGAASGTSTLSVTTTSGSATISYTGGTLSPGMPITGTGIPAGSSIDTVNAGAGTATLIVTATGAPALASASGAVTATITSGFDTGFTVVTAAAAGEIYAISSKGF